MTDAIQVTPAQKAMHTLRDMLEKAKPSLATVLPHHLTPERMVKLALVAASKNPTLLQCDTKSVVQSVMASAQLGLDCSGTLGSAYLVPYRNKGGGYTCQLIPGYRGLIDLARRSGQIASIEAHVVHERDEFEVAFGLSPVLTHRPTLKGDPGPVLLAYAVAQLRDGSKQVEVMTRGQLDGIRSRSKASSGPWQTDEEEMQRKTVVRRLCKYLPLSVELQQALVTEEAAESGNPVIDVIAEIEEPGDPEPPTESKTEKLARELKKRGAEKFEEPPAQEPEATV